MTEECGLRLPLKLICRSLGDSKAEKIIRDDLMQRVWQKMPSINHIDSTEVPCLEEYIERISPIEPVFAQKINEKISILCHA